MLTMTANIVPLFRRFHVQLAMGLCLVLTLLAALRNTAPAVPVTESAPPSLLAEPVFSVARHDLLWGDDFDAPPLRITRERYGRYLTLDARTLQFDPGAGVNGSGALRISWSAAERRSASCNDDSRVLEASFPATPSLTVSYWVRYSPSFVFDWSGRNPCSGNAKKLFLLWATEGSRFVFISENGALGIGSDHDHPLFAQNGNAVFTPADLADGAWHRVTLRVRQGSSPTARDGSVYGWIDGVLRWRYDNVVTHNAGGYHLFKMPATFNAGSPVTQVEWLDKLRIWRDE